MVLSASDFPDFTRAILLLGVDSDGNQVGVLLDSDGQLFALLRGVDALGAAQSVRVDALGQLYTVLKGASGHAVAVDSDGFISAVLKGQLAGVLTTISVDENGRIEAFMLDNESQWGDVLTTGNADLAARLGSVKAWDWRGAVLISNDFGSGVGNVQKTGGGADYIIKCSPEYYVHNGYALKMFGSSTGDFTAKAQWLFGKNPSTRLGLEVCFSSYFTYDYVDFGILVRGSGTRYNARFRYDPGSATLKYAKSDGSWGAIATVWIPAYPYAFNYMKIVANFVTGTYERFLINGAEYDLSAYAMESESAGFLYSIEVEVIVTSVTTKVYGIYLDYFTVTLDEPVNS